MARERYSYRQGKYISEDSYDEFQWYNPFDWFGAHDEDSVFRKSYYDDDNPRPSEYRSSSRSSFSDRISDIRSRRGNRGRDREDERESDILNKRFEQIEDGLLDQYNLKIEEQKKQIDELIDINLSYQRPAVIQTLFQEKQTQSYLPTNIRTSRGSVGALYGNAGTPSSADLLSN